MNIVYKSADDSLAHPVAEHEVRQVSQHNAADNAPANATDSADYLRSQNPLDCLTRAQNILRNHPLHSQS